ncbi:RHS repeat-associated core domain-containing protein [Luteibacter sp. W1I16]|uniref:RHS repeat-associated core domain-containing protein n=1 Tax=Luteibacter sp. W1I16 TaxID=3373922 RepID=UPI003D1D98C8
MIVVSNFWPMAMAQKQVTYYYTDPQGTPLAQTDATGNIVATFDYRPYGEQVLGDNSAGPGYTGHITDADIALTYMQQRYYDPSIGRFLTTDPLRPSGRNASRFTRYGYAKNNPYRYIDPDGRDTFAIGIGASASWLGGVAAQGQLTFSFPSANPTTWRLGGVGSVGGAASTELGLGVGLALSHSAADSAEEMADNGGDASVGGSVNLGPASIGYEQSMCSDCQPTRTLLIGPKLAVLPGEIHTTVAKSIGSTWVGSSPVTPTVTVGPAQVVSPLPAPVVEPVKDDKDTLPKENI